MSLIVKAAPYNLVIKSTVPLKVPSLIIIYPIGLKLFGGDKEPSYHPLTSYKLLKSRVVKLFILLNVSLQTLAKLAGNFNIKILPQP